MGATEQNNLVLRDAGGNWQKIASTNNDGVHTLAVSSVPGTSGGGGGSAPSVTLTTGSVDSDTFSISAGALAILIQVDAGTLEVDGAEVPGGTLSLTAPEGYLLPVVAGEVSGGTVIFRALRPA